MANYYGVGRSNYFAVKDEQKFRDFMSDFEVTIIKSQHALGEGLFGFLMDTEDGNLPSYIYTDDLEEIEVDFLYELSKHLADNWVAVFEHVGHEKLRYLTAYTYAVNSDGEIDRWGFSDFTKQAEKLGPNCTAVLY